MDNNVITTFVSVLSPDMIETPKTGKILLLDTKTFNLLRLEASGIVLR